MSLAVGTGEVHGLVGESGAGKSTIAKAILGILPSQVQITGGDIELRGPRSSDAAAERAARDCSAATSRSIPQDPSTALNPARRIDAQMTDGLRLKRGLSAKGGARARARACSKRCKSAIRIAC